MDQSFAGSSEWCECNRKWLEELRCSWWKERKSFGQQPASSDIRASSFLALGQLETWLSGVPDSQPWDDGKRLTSIDGWELQLAVT